MSDLDSFFAKKDRKKKKRAAPQATQAQLQSAVAAPGSAGVPVDASSSAVSGSNAAPGTAENTAASALGQPQTGTSTTGPRQDDGWVEFEDPKRQQVNTGGRKVASLKRDSAGVISQPASTSEEPSDGGNVSSSASAGGNNSAGGGASGGAGGTEFQGWKASDEIAAAEAEKAAAEKAAAEKAAAEAESKPAFGGVYRPKIWASRGPTQQGPDVKSASQFPSLADAARANAPEVPASMRAQEKGVKTPVTSGRPRFINSKRT